jgi:uncharacterized protein (UPF0332 family)
MSVLSRVAQDFKWSDYLALAEELLEDLKSINEYRPTDYAAMRCSVSRAYYAAYWGCRNHLEQNLNLDLKDTGETSHKTVIQQLAKIDKYVSLELNRLKDSRVEADYKRNISFTLSDSVTQIKRANKILDWLDTQRTQQGTV